MKKLLAMVLALVMTLSLAVSASAFKDDKDVSADYAEAVAVLNGMDVFKGYEDGSFKPQGNITRAEVATIIYRIYTGDVAKNDKSGLYSTYNKFSDMTGAGWAAGYIGYCANAELVKGYPDGTFKPSGNVTGYEVLAMILRAVGYDKNGEFSGADWSLNVAKYAEQLGVLKNVAKTTNLGAPATRELVAEILFRAIQQPTVTYTPAFGYVTDKALKLDETTLGKKNFNLDSKDSEDEWGRPSTKWYNTKTSKTYAEVVATPDASYNVATAQCDICSALGEKTSAKIVETYTNGVKSTAAETYKATATKAMVGAQGEQIEFYEVKDGYRLVIVDTYLAKVTSVVSEKIDKNNHVDRDDYTVLEAYVDEGKTETVYVDGNDYAKDDYVLVNINEAKANNVEFAGLKGEYKYVEDVAKAESFEGAQTEIWYNANKHIVSDKEYNDAVKFFKDAAGKDKTNKFTWLLDQFGNLIGSVTIDNSNYAVLKDLNWVYANDKTKGHAEATLVDMEGKEYTATVNKMDGFNYNGFSWYSSIDNVAPTYDDKGGFSSRPACIDVSREPKNNEDFLGLALYRVDTNDDGTVDLQGFEGQKNIISATGSATIDLKTSAILNDNAPVAYLTDDTQIIVRTVDKKDNNVYTAYTGTDKLPEMAAGSVYVMYDLNSNKIAKRVYVYDFDAAEEQSNLLFSISDSYKSYVETNNKEKQEIYYMDAYLGGDKVTIKTPNKELMETLAQNVGKLFVADLAQRGGVTFDDVYYAYGYLYGLDLVNEGTDHQYAGEYLVDYITGSKAEVTGNRIVSSNEPDTNGKGVGYYLTGATVISTDEKITSVEDLAKSDIFDTYGVWVVANDDVSAYNHAKYVYVGEKLSDDVTAKLTYTYTDAKGVAKTGEFALVADENNALKLDLETKLDSKYTYSNFKLVTAGVNSFINYDGYTWLGSYADMDYLTGAFKLKVSDLDSSAKVLAEDGVTEYTLTWDVAGSGVKDLIASLIDFDNHETVLYSGNGDCYADLDTAIANVKSLSYDDAESAQLMINNGVDYTSVKYRNFTKTADIVAAQIDQEIISTGEIEFTNAKNIIAVSITVDGTPYYAVFQVTSK